MPDDHSLIPIDDAYPSPGRSSRLVSRGVARLDSLGMRMGIASWNWKPLLLWDEEWDRVLWGLDSEVRGTGAENMWGEARWLDDEGRVEVAIFTMADENYYWFEWRYLNSDQGDHELRREFLGIVDLYRDIRSSLPGHRKGRVALCDIHIYGRNARGNRVGSVDDGSGIYEDGFPAVVKHLCWQTTACVLDDRTLIRLPSLGGPETKATAISDNGLIIGQSMTWEAIRTAVCWVDGRIKVLPGLGYEGMAYSDAATAALAVNTRGQIVGHATTLDRKQQAVCWVGGDAKILSSEFDNSSAVAINEAGQIVGVGWNDGEDTRHHLLWSGSGRCQRITLPGDFGVINNNGLIVGTTTTSAGHRIASSQAFVWHNGETSSLPIPLPYTRAFVYSVNDRGDVAGYLEYDVEFDVDHEPVDNSPGVPWQMPCVWLRSPLDS